MHTAIASRRGAANLALVLAGAVRTERFRLGLSQEALAELAGLDRTYISGLERGGRNPAPSTVERVAHALGRPPWQLLRPERCIPSPRPFGRGPVYS